jgi:hypothetical protein
LDQLYSFITFLHMDTLGDPYLPAVGSLLD